MVKSMNNMDQFYKADAEQSVIGGILLNSQTDKSLAALEMLLPSDFYLRQHQQIWSAICKLSAIGKPIDLITVSDQLEQGEADSDVGFSYLGEISKNTPSQANIHVYAKIVKDNSQLRKALASFFTATEIIYDKSIPPADRINASLSVLSKIGDDETQQTGKTALDCLPNVIDSIERAFNNKTSVTGLKTGFEHLDELLSGLQPADLIIVAARPSMGKSTFVFNIAENVAYIQKQHVMVFSLEMPASAIMQKSLSSLAGVPLSDIRNGRILHNDTAAGVMSATAGMMIENSEYLYIDDSAGLHISQLQARAKRRDMAVKSKGGLKLVVVDYLQLITAEGDNDTGKLTAVSNGLKALAKNLGCPVIALSQLNRGLTGRPKLTNLRGSGSIEQDGDAIIFLHDDDYQDEDSKRDENSLTEAIIAKQRMGPLGNVYLQPQLQYSRFQTTNRLPAPKEVKQPQQKKLKRYDE